MSQCVPKKGTCMVNTLEILKLARRAYKSHRFLRCTSCLPQGTIGWSPQAIGSDNSRLDIKLNRVSVCILFAHGNGGGGGGGVQGAHPPFDRNSI